MHEHALPPLVGGDHPRNGVVEHAPAVPGTVNEAVVLVSDELGVRGDRHDVKPLRGAGLVPVANEQTGYQLGHVALTQS